MRIKEEKQVMIIESKLSKNKVNELLKMQYSNSSCLINQKKF